MNTVVFSVYFTVYSIQFIVYTLRKDRCPRDSIHILITVTETLFQINPPQCGFTLYGFVWI